MYCGQRLRSSTGWTQTANKVEEGLGQADVHTRTFDVTPETDPGAHTATAPLTEIAGYRIIRFLGAGGMGAVYEAEAETSGQRVAIKLLSARLTGNLASVERFRQEGRVASQITHPRCVFVMRADTDAGRPFIVMELMPGTTLKDVVDEKGPLPPTDAIARILDVIEGLAEAHRLGVIHRDVKPSNCFLTADDRVKVGDFGLSKSLGTSDSGRHLTQTGAFLGTVLFASPEQIRGEQVGYDSDVYSVAGTLYYLLTGKAPYQHESMTAALAKAITEPPPAVRSYRPEVPAELDAAVLRGLERDRERRWQSLSEFGDSLRDLLPENNRPARPRVLALAYVIDVVLLQFVLVPLEVLLSNGVEVHPFALGWTTLLVAFGYFAPAEGYLGTTLGKKLLGLRVSRLGSTGPPGIPRAAVRTGVFHAILFGALYGLGAVLGTVPGIGGALGLGSEVGERDAWAVLAGLGVIVLSLQARKSQGGYRGVHDLLSGCHVTQRPTHPSRTRLVSRFPNPMDRNEPPALPLPATVGGFQVQGKVCELPDGGEAWAAEDSALGRRMLVRIFPPGAARSSGETIAVRPTRMRSVSHGAILWGGSERMWAAYVAPSGAPLVDLVTRPGKPLGWADGRSVIEQVTDELLASDADGSGVWRPTTDQVWIEPSGRVQVLDFPLPPGAGWHVEGQFPEPGPTDPMRFVRQVASLALEGNARDSGGPIRAPIPPHAARVMEKLFDDGPAGYPTLPKLWQDLAETHSQPAQVTASIRAAHLGVQAVLLAWGVSLMLTVTGLNNFARAALATGFIARPTQVQRVIEDPTLREATLAATQKLPRNSETRARLEAALAPGKVDTTVRLLAARVEHLKLEAEDHRRHLTAPEQMALDAVSQQFYFDDPNFEEPQSFLQAAAMQIRAAEEPGSAAAASDGEWWVLAGSAAVVLLVPVGWAGFAFVFRGGLAMLLAGITLVKADGRRAGRLRCAFRELLVWAPLTAVLLLTLWIQDAYPEMVLTRTVLWLVGVAMIPLYIVIALRDPVRPPQDRLAGTFLVPV